MAKHPYEIDIHVITESAETDAAAELIVGHSWHNPAYFEHLDERRRAAIPASPLSDIVHAKQQIAELDELQIGAFDEAGQLVAVAGIASSHRLEPGGCGQIVDVVTAYERRRMGLGSAVIGFAETFARDYGLEELIIAGVTRAGASLYENLGYSWDERRQVYQKDL